MSLPRRSSRSCLSASASASAVEASVEQAQEQSAGRSTASRKRRESTLAAVPTTAGVAGARQAAVLSREAAGISSETCDCRFNQLERMPVLASVGGGAPLERGRDYVAVTTVIFDMDGLMFDTERLARDAWRRAMAEHGYALDDSVYLAAVGRTVEAACRVFVDALGPDLPIEDIEAAKARYLQEMLTPRPPLKRGLVVLLDGIGDLGLSTAVASATARAEVERRLSSVDLLERFDAVVGGDEVARGKPAPDLFLRAGERLHVSPAGCVVLEDSEAGIRAAAAAGMIPVMVPDLAEPSPLVRALAAAVVGSLPEVLGVLQELGAARR